MSETEAVLKVNEIFKSIQGESTFAGLPTIFIRLQGCNLRCTYCDTKHAQDVNEKASYKKMTIDEVVEEVIELGPTGYICITGGEPMLQWEGIRTLLLEGYTHFAYQEISIETNGGCELAYDFSGRYIMDWKCPSAFSDKSQLQKYERTVITNLDILKRRYGGDKDEIKFVIANNEDYEYARSRIISICKYAVPAGCIMLPIHFSPAALEGRDWNAQIKWLAEKMVGDITPARLQIQLHKIIWPGVERGV